jgi:hypothetical protein
MEPLVLDMQSVMGVPPDNFSNGIYDDAIQNYVRVMWEAGCKFSTFQLCYYMAVIKPKYYYLVRPQLEKINAPWRMMPAEALSP